MDLERANKFNQIIMPELGNLIAEFYQLISTNNGDPLIIPGRTYKPIKDKLFHLRTLGGMPLAQSIGDPLATYEIMKRFQDLIGSFREEKGLFGSSYSFPRKQVLAELASIKDYAGLVSSSLIYRFK